MTLHTIATDKCGDADINIYETLPESNSARQMDCMISNAQVLTPVTPKPFAADLGIQETRSERLGGSAKSDGRIVEIGDLSTLSAKAHFDGADWLILPGRIALVEEWSAEAASSRQQIGALLARGVTSVIGYIDLNKTAAIEAMSKVRDMPINWGFVGRIDKARSLPPAELIERVAWAAAQGALAIASDRANEELWEQLDHVGLPLVQLKQLAAGATEHDTFRDELQRATQLYKLLNLYGKRGRIGRDARADIAVYQLHDKANADAAMDINRLLFVMVAGETVWKDGVRVGSSPGTFLCRR
ncbi:MAG TPA: hypothetical protein VFW73_11365, partial [Lacipirellulaceae bacterium]|nr:hypothetical protein [Lacipirellulaceae bacterium]